MKKWADNKRRHLEFNVEEMVLVKILPSQHKKFAAQGPHLKIRRAISHHQEGRQCVVQSRVTLSSSTWVAWSHTIGIRKIRSRENPSNLRSATRGCMTKKWRPSWLTEWFNWRVFHPAKNTSSSGRDYSRAKQVGSPKMICGNSKTRSKPSIASWRGRLWNRWGEPKPLTGPGPWIILEPWRLI